MANYFDQFDAPTGGNFFDQFDAPADPPKAKTQTENPVSSTRDGGWFDTVDAAVRGVADMVTFGTADKIAAGLGAATGIGGEFGDYRENMQRQQEIDAYDTENHPIARTAGQVAGAVALPVRAAPAGATFLARVGHSAAIGGGMGAAYGFGSGDGGLEERVPRAFRGLWTGALGGGAAPVALSGIGKGAQAIGNKFGILRGAVAPEAEAARRVSSALSRDSAAGSQGLSRAELAAAQADGVPVVVGDMGGEATRALARSATNTSPEARDVLTRVVSDRFAGQSGRIADDVASLSPLGANATASLDQLKAAAQAANRPAYAKAYAQGARGVWDADLAQLVRAPDLADAIRKASRTGANKAVADGFKPVANPFVIDEAGNAVLRTAKDGSQAIPTLQFWDHVKRNLDDTINAARRSGNGNAASDAIALKEMLVAKLDQAVPSYADARRGAASFFGAEDALEAGQKFVTAVGKNADFAKAISKMSEPEKKLFAEGFSSALSSRIRELSDRRDIIGAIFSSPASRERVRMALGLEGMAKLEARMRVESIMDSLRTAVKGNSTTVRQLAEAGMAGGLAGGLAGGWDPKTISMGALLGAVARRGVIKVDERVARNVGDMLASNDPKVIEKALSLAARQPPIMKMLKGAEEYLVRIGGYTGGQAAK